MSAGHIAVVHAVTRGATENYDLIRPTVIKRSPLYTHLERRFEDVGVNDAYAFPSFRYYWSLLRQEDPDVVIVRGVTRWFSRMALVVALLQRRRVVIYDQEDSVPVARSTWVRRAAFRALGIAHVTSRLPQFSSGVSLGGAKPLPFGAPSGCIRAERDESDTAPPRLLMVAKYRTRKGHRALLRALAGLAAELSFTLTFCGEDAGRGDREFIQSLEELADTLGLSARLRFENNVPNGQMGDLYAAHDLFILPSLQEPAAVSPIEAAWNGCAVLLSRDSGTRGYVPPGSTFDFDPEDHDDIARALRSAMQSAEHTAMLREQCYAHIRKVAGDDVVLESFNSMIR